MLDIKHLQLLNLILDAGGDLDCDDERLDKFQDDRGAGTDTINGLIDAGIVRQVGGFVEDSFFLRLAGYRHNLPGGGRPVSV